MQCPGVDIPLSHSSLKMASTSLAHLYHAQMVLQLDSSFRHFV